MKTFKSEFTPAFISQWIPGELVERKTLNLKSASELDEADQQSICFYQNKSFYDKLLKSKAGLIFVPADFDESLLPNTNLLKVEKPYIYYMMLIQKWLELEKPALVTKHYASTEIHETAEIAEDVEIGANSVIAASVKIGSGSRIGSNCYIGTNVEIGENCYLNANVNIYEDCRLGDNIILHSGVIIGADGFGFLLHQGKQFKLPQVGNVIIHNDVEIGANSCVDRATLGSTIIGEGTKLDNLVQIGHNCVVGKSTIICAQTGLAGNTRVGDRVYLAGQVGSADHVNIGDEVMVGAQSGVAGDVAAGKKVFGYPARDAGLTKRIMAAEKYLPDIVRYYRKKLKESK